MIVSQMGKFLNVEKNSFKGRDGSDVTFYKLGFIPCSDNKPLSVVCTKDCYDAGQCLSGFDDVMVSLEVWENRGYVKVRATFVGTDAQAIEY